MIAQRNRRSGRRHRVASGVALLLFAAGAAGCDDFLATEPRGELTTPNFFTNQSHAEQATNATYSMLRNWQVHVFSWLGMTDIVSDDATKGSVPADASFLLDLDNLNFDPGNTAFRDTWEGYYQGIFRANVAIQNIPEVEMDAALRSRLLAENRFLRAYYYFFLVRAFGGVPLVLEPLTPGDFERTRATADEVYAAIEADLLAAIDDLPLEYGPADAGRATRGAARALLGKVYLFRGMYAEAYAQLRQVIDSGVYSLHPSHRELFSSAGDNSPEPVFEVRNATLEAGGGSSQYAEVQGIRGVPNVGWGFNTPSPELEESYEPGDPRLQSTILYPWEVLPDDPNRVVYLNPSMPNNRYNRKAYTSPDTPRGSGNSSVNIRRIRYADVLLMAAEAAYRMGAEGEARELVNMVRERAREGRANTIGVAAELLSATIAEEVLGRGEGDSRVFLRYVNPATDAYAVGLRGFEGVCRGSCGSEPVPPVRVASIDLIESVGGVPVRTVAEFHAAVDQAAAGASVTLTGIRIAQAESGETSTEPFEVEVEVQALLPPVTAAGPALLEAIWHERRSELAMEQHRWFDIIRQGRAVEVMAAAGKEFRAGTHERFPLPATEVQITGLEQNPGY